MDDKQKNLLNDEDDQYERQVYLEQIAPYSEEAKKQAEKLKRQQEAEREKRIRQEKLELMKLKSGVIEESEVIKETHEPPPEMTLGKKIGNFWYHYKIPLIVGVAMLAAVIFMVVDTLTREKPDVYVLSTCDNGLEFRTDLLEEYFEKFCPDLNGDGEVCVRVISAPASEDFQISQSNQAKIITQLQMDQSVIILTCDDEFDLHSEKEPGKPYPEDTYVFADELDDLRKQFPDNDKVIEKGYKFYGDEIEKALQWDNMPQNIILSLRYPHKPLSGKLETMQKNYDIAIEVLKKIMAENDN